MVVFDHELIAVNIWLAVAHPPLRREKQMETTKYTDMDQDQQRGHVDALLTLEGMVTEALCCTFEDAERLVEHWRTQCEEVEGYCSDEVRGLVLRIGELSDEEFKALAKEALENAEAHWDFVQPVA